MSRLLGLSASRWEDNLPDPADESEDQIYFESTEQALAEPRAPFYREQLQPSLTRFRPSGRAARGGKVLDLTQTLFAAVELDRSVADVAEEMLSNAAEEELLAAQREVAAVVEHLLVAVTFQVESEDRLKTQPKDNRLQRLHM
jgi:hypothetical protein